MCSYVSEDGCLPRPTHDRGKASDMVSWRKEEGIVTLSMVYVRSRVSIVKMGRGEERKMKARVHFLSVENTEVNNLGEPLLLST